MQQALVEMEAEHQQIPSQLQALPPDLDLPSLQEAHQTHIPTLIHPPKAARASPQEMIKIGNRRASSPG